MTEFDLEALAWKTASLGDALDALCRQAKIGTTLRETTNPPPNYDEPAIGEWIAWSAAKRDLESDTIVTSFANLEDELTACYPALLQLAPGRFLAISSYRRGRLSVLTPPGKLKHLEAKKVARFLAAPLIEKPRQELESLLDGSSIPASRRAPAFDLLLSGHLRTKRFDKLWVLRTPASAPVRRWLRQGSLFRDGFTLVAAHALQYLLWVGSWILIGQLSLDGRLDRGSLAAWALLLFTLAPLRLLAVWKQGRLVVGAGGLYKIRLLEGAMRLKPDEIRSKGAGSFLTQAFEAETVETLALGSGIDGVLAVIELIGAGCILGWTALALTAFLVVVLIVSWRFTRQHNTWTESRAELTSDLVESMVGHRTRLVQQPKSEWHETEDQGLAHYLEASRQLDTTGTVLMAAVPRLWLVAGLACLAPAIVAGNATIPAMATMLGGILLAYSALKRVAASFPDIAGALSAWTTVRPLFHAASRAKNNGQIIADRQGADRQGKDGDDVNLIEAEGLTFRYSAGRPPVLKTCSLSLRRGERLLLEGPSGGGKSTLASVLTGMRTPDSGLLLMNGIDRQTFGEEQWRRHIVSAPQFHDNHVLTETLAFNLLMGRKWPPLASDLAEAEALCRDLGLGHLLDTMPAGIMQTVGEGGWQLSHGERSRIFIARALLQNADLVILDESFAALDPENLKTALECTLERAKTLLVIAHP